MEAVFTIINLQIPGSHTILGINRPNEEIIR